MTKFKMSFSLSQRHLLMLVSGIFVVSIGEGNCDGLSFSVRLMMVCE